MMNLRHAYQTLESGRWFDARHVCDDALFANTGDDLIVMGLQSIPPEPFDLAVGICVQDRICPPFQKPSLQEITYGIHWSDLHNILTYAVERPADDAVKAEVIARPIRYGLEDPLYWGVQDVVDLTTPRFSP